MFEAGAMLGGLSGFGAGVLIVCGLLVLAVVSLLPLVWLERVESDTDITDSGDDTRQLLTSL